MRSTFSRADVERLYVELGPALLAYGRGLLGDSTSAQDALHQLFLKLLGQTAFEAREARPYLYRALRNTALNLQRADARERARADAVPLFRPPRGLESVGLDLDAALGELPVEQREVVFMKVWGGLTFEEIAQVTDVPPNTAASRYRYGLARLRERLGAAQTTR